MHGTTSVGLLPRPSWFLVVFGMLLAFVALITLGSRSAQAQEPHTFGITITKTCPFEVVIGDDVTCNIDLENQDIDHAVIIDSLTDEFPAGSGDVVDILGCAAELSASDGIAGSGTDFTTCDVTFTVPLDVPCDEFVENQAEVSFHDAEFTTLDDTNQASGLMLVVCADLTLIKEDTEGNPQEGVLLQVTGPSPATTTHDCTTDATGTCTITGLAPGSYDVSEPTPPAGFGFVECTPDPVNVTIEGPNEVTCVNEFLTGDLTLIKEDTEGNPQEGVLLQVTGPSPDTTTHDCTTDATGTCTITGLAPGSYDVSEPTPPTGFDFLECSPDPVEVTVEGPNEVTCINEAQTGDLTLIKEDTEGNPQEGVLLEVTGPSPDTTTHSCTTDATGTCTITGLTPGSYDVSEPTPPTGFALVACTPDPVEVTAEGPNTVTCVNEPVGEEGCTPGYWKQEHHFDSWTAPYTPDTLFEDVFSDPNNLIPDDTTLLDALNFGGGPGAEGAARILARAAVASLLNAASPDVDFTMSVADVVTAVNAALASGDRQTMLDLAGDLDADNNLGCPINGTADQNSN